ncbi:MAG: sugE [Thermoleophilia bacterium]|jgi:quaternary ammonium compound-resistance protein SugE|nr:sugE [Thermoleophilia bacterium]
MSAWILLTLAALLEIVWALALKRSDGFARLPETIVFAAAAIGSMVLLARALRDLPVGTGYAVWTGTGAVGTALVGIAWLGESASVARLVSLALVVCGIAGLAATANSH